MSKVDCSLLKQIDAHDEIQNDSIPYPFLGNELTSEEKILQIEHHFEQILLTLGMDLENDSLKKTPYRYAKMLVQELFEGLNPQNFPKVTTQENSFQYKNMVIESHISIQSMCEHHFVPILGYCHIAYIPGNKIIGLSKLNRIAQFFAKRPQVQERLTKQIRKSLSEVLETPDVIVVVDALHLCVRMRGIQDHDSMTRTYDCGGVFANSEQKQHFFSSIPRLNEIKLS